MANEYHDNLKEHVFPRTMPAKSRDTDEPIVRRLRALVQESPGLKDAAALYEAILPLIRDADLGVSAFPLSRDQVRTKMEAGIPLLQDLTLELDVAAAGRLMIHLARVSGNARGTGALATARLPWKRPSTNAADSSRRIRLALEQDRLDPCLLLPLVASGRHEAVIAIAENLELDASLTMTLAQNALKPALRSWCREVTPLVHGITWNKGSCFVCGAVATFGELQDNEQVKHLRCEACGADWRYPRLHCAVCGNSDHATQRILYREGGHQSAFVEACDSCKCYSKVLPAFAATAPELIAIEDLATLYLDDAAITFGYIKTIEPKGIL
jgi:hypothetical protein